MSDAARKLDLGSDKTPALYREAPNNIEAEQALLGAILVNNDAFYRVSDFLKPDHFHEPLHRKIFEVAGDIIRMGKTANPVTIKTFLPSDEKVGDLTVAQYLARLAAEAVTIINAEDYGRAIYDLAMRRSLITIGEDMVNIAFDAPLDMPPQNQIEDAERRLFELAETGRYDGGFQSFNDAVALAVDMASAAYQRDGHLSGISTGHHRARPQDGRPAAVRPDHPRRPTGHGQDVARHQHRLQYRGRLRGRSAARRHDQGEERRRSSASSRWKCRPSSSPPASSPSRPRSLPRRSAAARSPSPTSRSSSPARR